jgi:hypothetical protein
MEKLKPFTERFTEQIKNLKKQKPHLQKYPDELFSSIFFYTTDFINRQVNEALRDESFS